MTKTEARLWTDGRYFLQASTELDANWTLMKDRLPETQTIEAYLAEALPEGSAVGIDAKLHSRGTPGGLLG